MMTIWMKLFPMNMSEREQMIRIAGGAVLLAIAIFAPTVWGWVGLYPLLTGFTGSSPVYRLLHIWRSQPDA